MVTGVDAPLSDEAGRGGSRGGLPV
jgi:hypothetical protein